MQDNRYSQDTADVSIDTDTQAAQLASLTAWLQLEYTARLPLDAVRVWLKALGAASSVWQASITQLAKLAGEPAAIAFKSPADAAKLQRQTYIDNALAWLAAGQAGTRHILTWDHPDYPPQLLTINDPPLVLFVQGDAKALSLPAVGIVGARNATQQGIANARLFAQALAEKNITVISGLALGIDAAAHEGALLASHNRYATVAVVGTGIDRVYPSSHRELAHRIAAQGAVVSEFPVGTPPIAHNFPRRNRLIAGLSRGVLVVEAAVRSGSLITARVAGEQGREVLAIPGSIHAPLSKGCHQLIKQGAKLVESAQDVLEELRLVSLVSKDKDKASKKADTNTDTDTNADFDFDETDANSTEALLQAQLQKSGKRKLNVTTAKPYAESTVSQRDARPVALPPTDDIVLAAMGHTPMDLDQIALATGLGTGALLSRLTELELMGDLEVLEGGRYQRLVA
jgi:DNA processing protein